MLRALFRIYTAASGAPYPDRLIEDGPRVRHHVQSHVESARQLRAEYQLALLRRAITSVARFVRSLVPAVRRWHLRNATYRELMALDDRLLKDIGLQRSQIRSVVDELWKSAPLSPPQPRGARRVETLPANENDPAIAANDNEPKVAA